MSRVLAASITAHELAVKRRTVVFGPVDLAVPAGGLLVVEGPAGSGKSSLLLTLGGRMRPTSGDVAVGGLDVPRQSRQVRRTVGLGPFADVNDLDDALTVEQHLAERLVMHHPWWRPTVGRARVLELAARLDALLDTIEPVARQVYACLAGQGVPLREQRPVDPGGSQDPAPLLPRLRPRERVSRLSPLERFVLGVLLGVAEDPRVLVVDDVDQLRDAQERLAGWALLAALTTPGGGRPRLTMVATCEDATAVAASAGAISRATGRAVQVVDLPSGTQMAASAPESAPEPAAAATSEPPPGRTTDTGSAPTPEETH